MRNKGAIKMIFVTVGTHEQPFNRLVEYMDQWAGGHNEEVVIQTGFSSYEPENCKGSKLYSYEQMIKFVNQARIVITHGGPASFIMPLQAEKIPVVVPRKKEFDEHVNDHQIDFCRAMVQRYGNIIVNEDIEKLGDVLNRYDEIISGMNTGLQSNNERFCSEFRKIVDELVMR